MTARILIVDDNKQNLKLLEVKLLKEYFEVIKAENGKEALELIEKEKPDIVLLDVLMPGMNGFEVCHEIRNNPKTHFIPVIMVTALTEPEDRVAGLNAGADDFLSKPLNDLALITRVRSLVRLKRIIDEYQARELTSHNLGVIDSTQRANMEEDFKGARVMLLQDESFDFAKLQLCLQRDGHIIIHKEKITDFKREVVDGDFELIIVDITVKEHDGLRIVSQIRTDERIRHLPILLIGEEVDFDRIMKALELGAHDYVLRPIDESEFLARVRTQVRRKRYQDKLKESYHYSINLALIDSLTMVYNRRYVDAHLPQLIEKATVDKKDLSVLIFDIDHFKKINDTYGHAVGDEILQQVTKRIGKIIRSIDLLARMGGEEFLVVLPETNLEISAQIGHRLLSVISDEEFTVPSLAKSIPVTISVGMAHMHCEEANNQDMLSLIKKADEALYKAKEMGRNQIIDHDNIKAA